MDNRDTFAEYCSRPLQMEGFFQNLACIKSKKRPRRQKIEMADTDRDIETYKTISMLPTLSYISMKVNMYI